MIPTRLHAALDSVSAAALILGPSVLGWRSRLRGPIAAAGVGVAGYSMMTRYRPASNAPLSMREHLALDAVQGVGFCAAAALLGRESPEVRGTLAAYGLFSLAAALLTDCPDETRERVSRQGPHEHDAFAPFFEGEHAREVAPDVA